MKNHSNQRHSAGSGGFPDKSQAFFYIHFHALFSSLGRLVRNPFTSAMTVVVMSIAISLASSFYLVVVNMQQLTANIESSNQISLFLKPSISQHAAEKLADKIRRDTQLDKVVLISKAQALDEFKAYSGFGDALNILDTNPLPIVIQVLPKNSLVDIALIENLLSEFKLLPQVDFAQLDMQWVKRLQSIMQIMQRGALLLSLLLGLAVIIITGNTIRLELQNRQDEVLVAKLVGATYSFIQRPFLYTGFWLGLLSGLVAWVLVILMMALLQKPIEQLTMLYNGAFDVLYLSVIDTLLLLSISVILGMLGAWVVLRYQLKLIKPE